MVSASDDKVWGVFPGNGYAQLRVIRMSKYIGANIRRQDCLLQAKMLETDAPKVEGARRREGDMHRWCCTNMGASHSSMVTLAHMGDNRSSSSCFTAQAARPAKVSRCQGVVQPCWIQMAERGDNADLEWGRMVFPSPSQLRASQPNGPVEGSIPAPLASTPSLRGYTWNISMHSK